MNNFSWRGTVRGQCSEKTKQFDFGWASLWHSEEIVCMSCASCDETSFLPRSKQVVISYFWRFCYRSSCWLDCCFNSSHFLTPFDDTRQKPNRSEGTRYNLSLQTAECVCVCRIEGKQCWDNANCMLSQLTCVCMRLMPIVSNGRMFSVDCCLNCNLQYLLLARLRMGTYGLVLSVCSTCSLLFLTSNCNNSAQW